MEIRLSLLVTGALVLLAGRPVTGAGVEQAAPGPEAAAVAAPAPVVLQDPLYRLEFKLPAPYWEYFDPKQLAEEAPGGCAAPRTSPNLLFVLNHKDAPANVWCEKLEKPFLMRDKGDLEAFINAFVEGISSQTGGLEGLEASYTQTGNPIIHRMTFAAPLRVRGGCGRGARGGEQRKMRYLFVHYFVRPRDSDAMAFKVFCAAPAEVFEPLREEFEFIIGSLSYTGALAEEFFVPDAPENKVLDAEAGRRAAGGGRKFNWLLPVAIIVLIWIMLRRKKEKAV
ncbi:MAG: hypothetical protein ACYS1C_09525 [Planctomycetota bacterium]|jgi:hypothetical protein